MSTATLPDFHASPKYLSCAETAKALRLALKAAFPGTKFSVRSKTYSGGASISFDWTDGPTRSDVEAISSGFAGGGFDGSIDMAYSVTSWMMPNGAIVAGFSGTQTSGGSYAPVINSAPHPDAVLVRFGANFVFASREYSDAAMRAALLVIESKRADGSLEAWAGFSLRNWLNDDRLLALNYLAEIDLRNNPYA